VEDRSWKKIQRRVDEFELSEGLIQFEDGLVRDKVEATWNKVVMAQVSTQYQVERHCYSKIANCSSTGCSLDFLSTRLVIR
jgi:hypothetical protein